MRDRSEAAIDQTYFWTGRDCPEEDCDGDLQQQDWMNVMCLSCERVWMHSRDSKNHKLRTQTFDTVAEEPILATDGGVDQDDGEVEHQIIATAIAEEERKYKPRERGGEVDLGFNGEVRHYLTRKRKMYRCTCGAGKFRKDETALRHLREVGALAE